MFKRLICFILCSICITLSFAQIERIEPGNWWVGMKDSKLQLLVHGDKIGNSTPSINYPGVSIKKISKGDSPNYLFIDLVIATKAKPGTFNISFRQTGQQPVVHPYTLLAREKGRANLSGFNSADVIYLITPDRFANGNVANDINDSMREKKIDRKNDYARHGGDIGGIIDHLDYIASMGFTAIWPTPLLENDMRSSSYHGYAITDYYKVDPRFGTLDEYKELANKARAKGIKLIFDGVVNHSGLQYWWMKDLPFRNWINYPDSMKNTNHRRTTNQDPYASAADKELMVKGWFVSQMPDLNQENLFLSEFLIQNSIWWIETLGLGGIRQDTYPYSQKKFLEQWTCRIMKEYPFFSLVGEEWSTNPLIAAYWQKGKPNKTNYNGCLKSPMDFPMQSAIVHALTEDEGWDKGLVKIYEGLANDFVYENPNDLMVFGDNHDMDRIFTQLNKDPQLLQMAMTYLLTMRGIPQVYYGTEIQMDNSAKRGDHGLIRTDFPGGWENDAVNGFTGTGLSETQLKTQNYLKALLNWRKKKKVIHEGKTLHFAPANGVYVYFRYDAKDTVMIVLNKNVKQTELKLERFKEILGAHSSGVDVITGGTIGLEKVVTLEPKSAIIIEIN